MHDEADGALRGRRCRATPIATSRSSRPTPAETFKHILVPVWLLTYTYGARVFQVVANGYTGEIAGKYPKSPWKIAGAVLLAIVAIITIVVLAQK